MIYEAIIREGTESQGNWIIRGKVNLSWNGEKPCATGGEIDEVEYCSHIIGSDMLNQKRYNINLEKFIDHFNENITHDDILNYEMELFKAMRRP